MHSFLLYATGYPDPELAVIGLKVYFMLTSNVCEIVGNLFS